jgi:hypothetical protein
LRRRQLDHGAVSADVAGEIADRRIFREDDDLALLGHFAQNLERMRYAPAVTAYIASWYARRKK